MLRSLRHYYYCFRFPELKRYINEGFGIAARQSRANKWWEPHLRCSKEFQKEALKNYNGSGAVTIIGAGRLYDIDVSFIRSKFKEVYLIDIDPSCISIWNQAFKGHSFKGIICDLSGSYKTWNSLLTKLLSSAPSDHDICTLFKSFETSFLELPKSDVVLSMNILGQLPLSWRDVVHEELLRRIGLNTNENGEYEPLLQESLCDTFLKLQKCHLLQLGSSSASQIILTTDASFMYYKKDMPKWQVEKALYIDAPLSIDGFSPYRSEGWFWHLAPQGIEFNDYGVIHDIEAFDFRKL